METLRTSSYTISINLKDESKRYMLIHGYTGAIDVVNEDIATKLIQHDNINEDIFSPTTLQILEKRGYITVKSQKEEYDYVMRIAHALHKKYEILYKTFTWIITYNCNFRCPYCFENRVFKDSTKSISFTQEMADKTFKAMNKIESRMQLQSNIITLYGGEPLLKENKEIITYIVNEGKKKGYKFYAVTNGYDLEYFVDLLASDLIYKIQITIDGTKEFHNQKRKHFENQNSFDKILSNIQLILSLNLDVKIMIRVNIDNKNLDDFVELKKYLKQTLHSNYENLSVYSALISDNDSISDQEKDNLNILSTKDYIHKHIERGSISSCNGYNAIYKKIYNAIVNQKTIPLRSTYCSSQAGGYVFSPLGEIYPCWEVVGNKNYQIGRLSNNSIEWNDEELNKWRSHDISTSTCKYCKYALICGGGCQALKNNHCTYFQEMLRTAVNDVYAKVCKQMFNQ